MGSMGDSDRKRRHFSSLSPTPAAATTKKLPFLPVSEDKKLDIVVLQYQNQKLTQKLETQKLEYAALENRVSQLKERQKSYDSTLAVVRKSWEQLVNDLESCSECTRESSSKSNSRFSSTMEDGSPSTVQDVFLGRLMQTGATECASTCNYANQMEEQTEISTEKAKSVLKNIVISVNNLWVLMDGLRTALLKKLPGDVLCRQTLSSDLEVKVKNLRLEFSELHLKHKSLASEFQIQRDLDAKNKADLERLKGELASTVEELEESNHKLATLKAERDAAKGAVLPVLNVGSTHIPNDKIRDKQKDLQDMESTLKELLEQGSTRLIELKSLHEERIRILQQLCDLQVCFPPNIVL
ncbi:E3 ubiquitin-protein ligase BRE1-like 1 [Cajanus cajan]|uniref:E3 ubiquitin protein ligase n=1 Tax=Cajanus cajan TaxID=3821 RepID=A0A151R8L2_CAJCA|nr:E3 ubiquitin-protein ligase BRE1-like 1 [Cajanus cajan]KYP38846.1 E3 ubiquitin-protein ligase BRE1-like 1 [Cajanus cajan]